MRRSAVAIAFTAVATAVSFQSVPQAIALRSSDGMLSEPFTRIHSIRELADSRVLVSDNSSETRLVVADLRTDRVRRIGLQGSGPGEYRVAGRLLALPADSTLLVDGERGRRWLILAADSIVRTVPPDHPAIMAAPGDLFGADARGNVLGLRGDGADRIEGDFSRLRNVAILASRLTFRADTFAKLRSYDQYVEFNKARTFSKHTILVGSEEEQVQLFPDGWIAMVRIEPYRVDWRRPDGTVVRGPDLKWDAPRSNATERRARAELYRRRTGHAWTWPDGMWADRIAPIRAGTLGTPEGNILVARSQWSKVADSRYDLINRSGRVLGQLVMPDSERVVGFGSGKIYVSITDGDGFQRLRRHPWP
jgi:hypothetical protein